MAVASVDGDAYAPADWWGGKTCSDWGRTQVVLNNSINAAGGPGQVCAYTGSTLSGGLGEYLGCVLTSNNRIYFMPGHMGGQTNWHYINVDTGSLVAYAHEGTTVNYPYQAYSGGVLTPGGRIYMIPYDQGGQTNWHYIDVHTGTIVPYTHAGVSTVATSAYAGGVLAPNGRIYMIPFIQADQSTWHYIDSNGTPTGYSHGLSTPPVVGGYFGGVLAPSGKIYMCPRSQLTQSKLHYIDTSDGSVHEYLSGVSGVANAYSGGVLTTNGRIYLIPFSQATQTSWHYIDTSDGSVHAYTHGLGAQIVNSAYVGGVLAPNGRIYMTPFAQAAQPYWHYIDTNTGNVVSYAHGSSASGNAYEGGVLAPNGRIYMAPYGLNSTTWHYIDTQSDKPLPVGVCTNPMFNKF